MTLLRLLTWPLARLAWLIAETWAVTPNDLHRYATTHDRIWGHR